MKKYLWLGIGTLLLFALGFGGWWIWGRPAALQKVKVGVITSISMQEEVYATGKVVPVSLQEVTVLNPGRISKLEVKVGDSVQAGQILVRMDSTLADAQVAQAKANVEAAQTNVAIAQTNAIEGVLAQNQAALKQAQEALKVSRIQQEQLIYKASISGTVLEVNGQEGALSPVQQPLILVADLGQMNVESNLNEVDSSKVQLGGKATVSSKTMGNTSVLGAVVEIAPEATTNSGVQGNLVPTVRVLIRLEQVPAGLKPGYTVKIQLIVASKEGVLAVPQEALFQEGNQNYVYRIIEGRLRKTEVKIGIGNDTHQEILSGLNAGDQVMLNPSSQFAEGMQVSPDNGSGAI